MSAPITWCRTGTEARSGPLQPSRSTYSPGARTPMTRPRDHRPTPGNPPGTRPLHDLNPAHCPFLPSSLALGIPRHPGHGKQPSYRSPQPAHRGLNLCAMTPPAPPMAAATTPRRPSRTLRSTTGSSPSGEPRRSPRSGSPPRTTSRAAICPRCRRRFPRCRPPLPQVPAYGYPQAAPHPAPLQQAPTAYIPQQAAGPVATLPSSRCSRRAPWARATRRCARRTPSRRTRPAPAPYQDPYNNGQYRGY